MVIGRSEMGAYWVPSRHAQRATGHPRRRAVPAPYPTASVRLRYVGPTMAFSRDFPNVWPASSTWRAQKWLPVAIGVYGYIASVLLAERLYVQFLGTLNASAIGLSTHGYAEFPGVPNVPMSKSPGY